MEELRKRQDGLRMNDRDTANFIKKNKRELLFVLVVVGMAWLIMSIVRSNPNYLIGYDGYGYKTYDFKYQGQRYAFDTEDRSWVWLTQIKRGEPNIVIPETVKFCGKEYPVKGLGWHMNYHWGKKIEFDTLTIPPGIEAVASNATEGAEFKKLILTGKNKLPFSDMTQFMYGRIDEIECLSEEPSVVRFIRSNVKRIIVPQGSLDAYKEALTWIDPDTDIVEKE